MDSHQDNADDRKSLGRFILRGVMIASALLLLLIVVFLLNLYLYGPDT